MSNDLERFKLEERIYLSSAKHRGNADLVAKELNLPYEFVAKMCKKIEKRQKRDVNVLICSHIMGAVMVGRESRIQYYTIMLNALEGKDSLEVSSCCKSIFIDDPKGSSTKVCIRCEKPANSYMMHQGEVYRTRIELLSELRKEDSALVEFAEKMGYTNKQDEGMVYKDQRKYLIVGGQSGKNPDELPETHKLLLEDAKKLTPIERTDLINEIQNKLFEQENPNNGKGPPQ
jgi:hypothetical protein